VTFTVTAGALNITVPASVNLGSGAAATSLTGQMGPVTVTDRTAFTLTLGVGNNSFTWNPSLIVAIPAAAVAGLYTGTVTHSVAP
jgi:hypothetical protein